MSANANSNASQKMAVTTVTEADLPVYCPGPTTPLWNMHPRVYKEIGKEGTAICPYCSASYQVEKSATSK